MIYENNIFSKYFLMLDDILNCECDCNEQGTNYIPFLTKEQINDIKNLKIENEKNKSPSSAPFPYHFTIELYETDNPLYEKSETFYIKNENVSQNEKKNKNCINAKPLFLSLTPQQIELDEKITTSIQKGESFTEINKIFTGEFFSW